MDFSSHPGIFKNKSTRSKRNKYEKIESDSRRKLLYMVKDLKISIKEAAQFLGINYSTSKTILQLYRKTGRIDRLERKYLLQLQLERQCELGFPFMQAPLFPAELSQGYCPWKVPSVGNSLIQGGGSTCTKIQASEQSANIQQCFTSNYYQTQDNTPMNITRCGAFTPEYFGQNQVKASRESSNLTEIKQEKSVNAQEFDVSEKDLELESKKMMFDFSKYKALIYKEMIPGLEFPASGP